MKVLDWLNNRRSGRGKTVAIVGFNHKTMHFYKDEPETTEIWTLNWAWHHDINPISRLFELHQPQLRINTSPTSRKHEDWLREKHDFPIYMMPGTSDGVPSAVDYPWSSIVREFVGDLTSGDEIQMVFTCTVDYMMALAIYEGYDKIKLFGTSEPGDIEYEYQREGAAYWMGVANAYGVEVELHPQSKSMKHGVYHIGGQIIGRNRLWQHLKAHTQEHRKMVDEMKREYAKLELIHADLQKATINRERKALEEKFASQQQVCMQLQEQVTAAEGAIGALEGVIQELDETDPLIKESLEYHGLLQDE